MIVALIGSLVAAVCSAFFCASSALYMRRETWLTCLCLWVIGVGLLCAAIASASAVR